MNIRRRRGCPTDGELRLAIDVDGKAVPAVQQHLDHCAACTVRFDAIAAAAGMAGRTISTLGTEQTDLNVNLAYSRFRQTMAAQPAGVTTGGSRMGQLFATRSMRAASALVAVIAVIAAVTFSPMRTVADDFLNQFRVQKFAAVTIPMDALSPFQSLAMDGMSDEDKQQFQDELNKLGAFDTTFEYDHDNLPAPITLAEAEAQFGDIEDRKSVV